MAFRVAIVGGGSAGMVCATTLLGNSQNFKTELTLITDPNIPPIRVGESMSPTLMTMMHQVLGILSLDNSCKSFEEMNIMTRVGTRHTWENNCNPGFDVNYDMFSLHFDSAAFISFARKRLKELFPSYTELNETIKSISQNDDTATAHGVDGDYTYDFIIDCRGFPTKEELNNGDYKFPEFDTVNSLLVFQHHHPYTHQYTDVTLHKNGWQFGINTTKRKAFGYLYNKDITSKDDALEHYLSLNKDIPIVENEIKSLSWQFYTAKKAIDNRVIKMGNKLYFYEPVQGIPLHHYCIFTLIIIDYMAARHFNIDWNYRQTLYGYLDDWHTYSPEEAVNEYHSRITDRYFEIVCTNYIGNSMNSEFWNVTKKNSVDRLLKSVGFVDFARKVVSHYDDPNNEYPNLYIHPSIIIKQYMEGFQVNFRKILDY